MSARGDIPRPRDEAGFTLVELLVAMALSIVVLLAVLGTLDNFTRSAASETKITDADDQVRNTMDHVVSDLRQANTIEVAGANDLVYTVVDSATQTRRERLCLDSAGRLWRASVKTASPAAVPIAAGTPCPTPGSGAFRVSTLLSANSASNPLFRYDSATAASVRSVGLTFALKADYGQHAATSTLRASAFVRFQGEKAPNVAAGDIGATCSSSGVPTLTLSASVGSLTVSYSDLNGNALGSTVAGAGLTLPASATTVVATVSSLAGGVTQLVKTLAC